MNSKQRTTNKKPLKEHYLKMPYHILNLPALELSEKVLLAHIYSFGEKGCWQSNETLAKMFMTSQRTISRYIAKLKPFIYVKKPKGYFRTIWAKSYYDKSGEHQRQNQHSDCDKKCFRLRQKCLTTNINTIKENYKDITATPPPLPSKGAPALLQERRRETLEMVEQFKRTFGKKKFQPLSEEEFERRKQAQIKALSGSNH